MNNINILINNQVSKTRELQRGAAAGWGLDSSCSILWWDRSEGPPLDATVRGKNSHLIQTYCRTSIHWHCYASKSTSSYSMNFVRTLFSIERKSLKKIYALTCKALRSHPKKYPRPTFLQSLL